MDEEKKFKEYNQKLIDEQKRVREENKKKSLPEKEARKLEPSVRFKKLANGVRIGFFPNDIRMIFLEIKFSNFVLKATIPINNASIEKEGIESHEVWDEKNEETEK